MSIREQESSCYFSCEIVYKWSTKKEFSDLHPNISIVIKLNLLSTVAITANFYLHGKKNYQSAEHCAIGQDHTITFSTFIWSPNISLD